MMRLVVEAQHIRVGDILDRSQSQFRVIEIELLRDAPGYKFWSDEGNFTFSFRPDQPVALWFDPREG